MERALQQAPFWVMPLGWTHIPSCQRAAPLRFARFREVTNPAERVEGLLYMELLLTPL